MACTQQGSLGPRPPLSAGCVIPPSKLTVSVQPGECALQYRCSWLRAFVTIHKHRRSPRPQDAKDTLLGRLFGLGALLRSGLDMDAAMMQVCSGSVC